MSFPLVSGKGPQESVRKGQSQFGGHSRSWVSSHRDFRVVSAQSLIKRDSGPSGVALAFNHQHSVGSLLYGVGSTQRNPVLEEMGGRQTDSGFDPCKAPRHYSSAGLEWGMLASDIKTLLLSSCWHWLSTGAR